MCVCVCVRMLSKYCNSCISITSIKSQFKSFEKFRSFSFERFFVCFYQKGIGVERKFPLFSKQARMPTIEAIEVIPFRRPKAK